MKGLPGAIGPLGGYGVGPVEVRRAKVRDRGDVGAEEKSASPRRSCRSGHGGRRASMRCCRSLPAWGIDSRLPGSPRRPLGQGRAEPVAGGDLAADGRMAGGLRRLAEARPLGAAIRVRVGGWGLPAGPNGRCRRMHAGADRRNTRRQEGTRCLPDRGPWGAQSWRELLIDIKRRGLELRRTWRSATLRHVPSALP